MEKDILSQVIEVEKEIQKCIEAEKIKAHEWLEAVKKESQEQCLLEEKKINDSLQQFLAEESKQAEARAAEIERQAAITAERLGQMKTEVLTGIIEREVARILP